MTRAPLLLPLLALIACRQDIGLTQAARCDGQKQQGEEYVDAAFDRDGDGYFDGANPDCVLIYAAEDLDCDDTDPDTHPDAEEVLCDGKDNDCDAETVDDLDQDGDGWMACEDCNDTLAGVNPGVLEVDCNGLDDDCDPTTLDGIDYDNDGYDECEDCDEQRANVNPGGIEVFCDGLDNDCNPGTEDSPDADFDGVGECDDCDDRDPTRSPDLDEVCDDGVDNNCDGFVDEECGSDVDPTGWWDVNDISYTCAGGLVSVSVDTFQAIYNSGNLSMIADGRSGGQPGQMTGLLSGDGSFNVYRTIPGTCNEDYGLSGTFTSENEFEGTFNVWFTGSCVNCRDQVWAVTGTRQ